MQVRSARHCGLVTAYVLQLGLAACHGNAVEGSVANDTLGGGGASVSQGASSGQVVGGAQATITAAGRAAAMPNSGGSVASSLARGGNNAGSSTTLQPAAGGSVAAAGGAYGSNCGTTLPAHTTSTTVSSTIAVSGIKDYGMQRICADPDALGPGDQSESQSPVFKLAKDATLKNVILGGPGCSAADGIHCSSGSCTLENVWIGDVGEDAITFKGSDASQVLTIIGGGAFDAADKVVQHNGPGTVVIKDFFVRNAGKLYRSCGNCGDQYARHVELTNVFASGIGEAVVGINTNYGDTASIHSIVRCGGVPTVCRTYVGNDTGDEPTVVRDYATTGDGTYCIFDAAAVLQ